MRTHYDLLGVTPVASAREVHEAHVALATILRAQRRRAADPEARADAEAALEELEEARRILTDPEQRRVYDASLADRGHEAPADGSRPDDGRPPGPVGDHPQQPDPGTGPTRLASCAVCGSSPATDVHLTRYAGIAIVRRREDIEITLCRDCGIATFRELMNRTLVAGWWSLNSFLPNIWAIVRNLRMRRRLRRLGAPHPGPRSGRAPLPGPMDPGARLTGRPGPWVTAGLFGLIGVVVVAGILTEMTGDGADASVRSELVDVFELAEGDCFDEPGRGVVATIEVVPCEDEHDHEVYAVAPLGAAADTYPGDDAVIDRAVDACREEFDRFVGLAYESSVLDFRFLHPTVESWADGDRDVVCFVFDQNGPVTGSLAGAGR